MDAHALLTSQGWRGTGNSLHPTSNTIGLSKPLLVSKKQDNLGIGKKQHRTSDMWWMNAFDSSLKGLDTSKEGTVVQTITSGGLDMVTKAGAKWVGSKGGLYASFVRGESLSGTITPVDSTEGEEPAKKKRKREVEVEASEGGVDDKEMRRARKAAKRAKAQGLPLKNKSEVVVEKKESNIETKEERSARKAAKRALREKPAEKVPIEDIPKQMLEKLESKEERNERKRLKKLAQQTEDTSSTEKAKKKKR